MLAHTFLGPVFAKGDNLWTGNEVGSLPRSAESTSSRVNSNKHTAQPHPITNCLFIPVVQTNTK